MEDTAVKAKTSRLPESRPLRVVFVSGAILVVFMALFPPWMQVTPSVRVGQAEIPAKTTSLGYRFLGSPPAIREPVLKPTKPFLSDLLQDDDQVEKEWVDQYFQPRQDEIDKLRAEADSSKTFNEMLDEKRSRIPSMIRMVVIDTSRFYFQLITVIAVVAMLALALYPTKSSGAHQA